MFKLCKIVIGCPEDKDFILSNLRRYPIEIVETFSEQIDIPTLILGWSKIKELFPEQNIFDKKIKENLYWTFSKTEMEQDFISDTEIFVNDSIKKWLPKDFLLFDSVFSRKNLDEFLKESINNENMTYVYFHKNAMYLHNSGSNFIVNIKSLGLYDNNYRQQITDFLNKTNCFCLSYKNFLPFAVPENLKKILTLENVIWVKYGNEINDKYFEIIPGFDIYRYIPFLMSKVCNFEYSNDEKVAIRRMCERDLVTEWLSQRYVCFDNSLKNASLNFVYRDNNKFAKLNYSNKRAITGRIICCDSYNPQNLTNDGDDRKNIITRFHGGKIVVFDYTSFESRIALYSCEDKKFIEENYRKDLHYEVARIILKRNDISKPERNFAKTVTHAMLYGASRETVLEKLRLLTSNENTLQDVRNFIYPLLKQSFKIKKFNDEYGYIINKWGSIIRTKAQKEYASFNNYIQSTATEIIVDKLMQTKSFLNDKKSELLFQVHDSIVFDIPFEEINNIPAIEKILSNHNEEYYPVTCMLGNNYKDLFEKYNFS